MAVGKDFFPKMYPVPGFRLGASSAGIKKSGKKDLVVMELAEGSTVGGSFTKNLFCAAPVKLAKERIYSNKIRYLVTNTGNANAGTGDLGRQHAESICESLAKSMSVNKETVLPFSTGVIGEYLPIEKIISALPSALSSLSENGWDTAAMSILTTDTRPKGASVKLKLSEKNIIITGIAKGSGMIRPDMATMLTYIATDIAIDQELIKEIIRNAVDCSFNRITVDGDMSTNDSAILVATGLSGVDFSELSLDDQKIFIDNLKDIFLSLACQVVQDGEGASKFVTVRVSSGKTASECLRVGYSIAESSLVKTALFASDPNWGRILSA
ncbi:MAG: bifunctional glutamate N-acetyltransferase/amino-acid acetyltransferase ArgJ, partial [Gammaproteobacteria bacterium]|nr:bifunctional glutamate N-acetyltransferase/amino-acid acetyltransferase ArgJ [Gammaproteobacteria bacterium]